MIRGLYKTDVVTITPDRSVKEAAVLMRDKAIGDVVVCAQSETGVKPVGILTDRDIVTKCIAEYETQMIDMAAVKVEDLMSTNICFVKETAGLFDTIRKMREAGVSRILVVDDNEMLMGILTSNTIFELLNEELHELGMIARSRRSMANRERAITSGETPDTQVQH